MKKRKKSSEEGSWLNTYADMVTLLLCFFVLLYSISSVDQTKWQNFVLSINPGAAQALEEIYSHGTETQGAVDENENEDVSEDPFEQMFYALLEASASLGIEDQVSISQGDGYTFISFKDKVFFDGDSPVLKEDGKKVLDMFTDAIAPAAEDIKEIEVLGHTSQGNPDRPNNVITDRVLSAERSAQIVAYIQKKNVIEPAKLVSMAFGQFRPIDTFQTTEGRAHNRRAEILITKDGTVERSLSYYYEQVYGSGTYEDWMDSEGEQNGQSDGGGAGENGNNDPEAPEQMLPADGKAGE